MKKDNSEKERISYNDEYDAHDLKENIISWGWRIVFLFIWCLVIAPMINESLTEIQVRGRISDTKAVIFAFFQSIIYVVRLIPLFLKYLSTKGISLNIGITHSTDENNQKLEKNTKKKLTNQNKTRQNKKVKIQKISFNQQAKIIEKFINDYDFTQTEDKENYTYEFDYIKEDQIIFLEIE
tara:strand:+ start:476 stop:1018 length:543 start_codon:yes stop_codon:yes gene_type:complete